MIGAMLGAFLVGFRTKIICHTEDEGGKLACFSTTIQKLFFLISEIIGTFVLIFF
jgi:glycerol uptake facilitator-like aquaporin